jgi:hypothetical protein
MRICGRDDDDATAGATLALVELVDAEEEADDDEAVEEEAEGVGVPSTSDAADESAAGATEDDDAAVTEPASSFFMSCLPFASVVSVLIEGFGGGVGVGARAVDTTTSGGGCEGGRGPLSSTVFEGAFSLVLGRRSSPSLLPRFLCPHIMRMKKGTKGPPHTHTMPQSTYTLGGSLRVAGD